MAHQIEQRRATNNADAFWTLDPLWPVQPDDPWYADLESHFEEGEYDFVAPLVRRLVPPSFAAQFCHVGVIGHRGSGKSTLVRRAMATMEADHGFRAVYVNVEAMLDRGDFTFADALMTIVNAVAGELAARGATMPKDELNLFKLFFAEELLTEDHVKELSGSIEASAEVGGSLWFAKLMGKVTALVRSDSEYRREIRRKIERDPQDMIRRANLFLDAASRALERHLVVVFDNLEKVSDRGLVEAAFLARAEDIRSLRAAVVLFLHPADEYTPQKVRASEAFPLVTLPMLPVRVQSESYGTVSPRAISAAHALLDRRADLASIFDDAAPCVRRLVELSGGRLRDVLEVMRAACERAGSRKVSIEIINRVARKIAGERSASLHVGDHERLLQVSRTKQVPNDDPHGYLLLHSMILQYNGVPWWDIHPILLLLPDLQTKIAAG